METETIGGKTVSKTWNEFEDFNVGDVVRLKSGGPDMTVDAGWGSRIAVAWFESGSNILQRSEFDQGALEKVVAAEKSVS